MSNNNDNYDKLLQGVAGIQKALSGLYTATRTPNISLQQPINILGGGMSATQVGIAGLRPILSAAFGSSAVGQVVGKTLENILDRKNTSSQYNVWGMTAEGFANTQNMRHLQHSAQIYAKKLGASLFSQTSMLNNRTSPLLNMFGIDISRQEEYTAALADAGKAWNIRRRRQGWNSPNSLVLGQQYQNIINDTIKKRMNPNSWDAKYNFGNFDHVASAQLASALLGAGVISPGQEGFNTDKVVKQLHDFGNALSPLTDLLGQDVPKIIQTIQTVAQRSIGSMSADQVAKYTNAMRSSMTINGISAQTYMSTMGQVQGAIDSYSARTGNRYSRNSTLSGLLAGGVTTAMAGNTSNEFTTSQSAAQIAQFTAAVVESEGMRTLLRAYNTAKQKNPKLTPAEFSERIQKERKNNKRLTKQQAALKVAGVGSKFELFASGGRYEGEGREQAARHALQAAGEQIVDKSGVSELMGLEGWDQKRAMLTVLDTLVKNPSKSAKEIKQAATLAFSSEWMPEKVRQAGLALVSRLDDKTLTELYNKTKNINGHAGGQAIMAVNGALNSNNQSRISSEKNKRMNKLAQSLTGLAAFMGDIVGTDLSAAEKFIKKHNLQDLVTIASEGGKGQLVFKDPRLENVLDINALNRPTPQLLAALTDVAAFNEKYKDSSIVSQETMSNMLKARQRGIQDIQYNLQNAKKEFDKNPTEENRKSVEDLEKNLKTNKQQLQQERKWVQDTASSRKQLDQQKQAGQDRLRLAALHTEDYGEIDLRGTDKPSIDFRKAVLTFLEDKNVKVNKDTAAMIASGILGNDEGLHAAFVKLLKGSGISQQEFEQSAEFQKFAKKKNMQNARNLIMFTTNHKNPNYAMFARLLDKEELSKEDKEKFNMAMQKSPEALVTELNEYRNKQAAALRAASKKGINPDEKAKKENQAKTAGQQADFLKKVVAYRRLGSNGAQFAQALSQAQQSQSLQLLTSVNQNLKKLTGTVTADNQLRVQLYKFW